MDRKTDRVSPLLENKNDDSERRIEKRLIVVMVLITQSTTLKKW